MKKESSVKKKRILILTADAGFGHRSAALAVEAALVNEFGNQIQVDLINPLEDKRAPFLLRESQADYDKWVRKAPELYKLGYEASDASVPSAIMESALTVMLFEVMHDILKTYHPNVIVSTYPLYQAPLSAVFSFFRVSIPVVTVVTDLATVHRMWFNKDVEKILVPNPLVAKLAEENGLQPQQIQVTGIPVHPRIVQEKRTKAEIRAELGWKKDLVTVLAVGSKRVKGMQEALQVINHFGLPLQLAVVSGKDEEMFAELQSEEWHQKVHLYEFVNNMPDLMHASDLIVSKAGGLIVTESLACGLPMLLVDVIPGQEEGNMQYVVDREAGELVDSPLRVMEALSHLLMNDGELLRKRANNALQAGKPDAAFTASRLTFSLAQKAPSTRDDKLRLSLLDLLRDNQIAWSEDDTYTTEE